MKNRRKAAKPANPSTIETFGGDYHRFESTFPQKGETTALAKPAEK
jgi:hypothetical protein